MSHLLYMDVGEKNYIGFRGWVGEEAELGWPGFGGEGGAQPGDNAGVRSGLGQGLE